MKSNHYDHICWSNNKINAKKQKGHASLSAPPFILIRVVMCLYPPLCLCSFVSLSCPDCPHSQLDPGPCWLCLAGGWFVQTENQLLSEFRRPVWGGNNLAMSLTELMCLACHCSSPVPLVTAGLMLSCVLIRHWVNHTPGQDPISENDLKKSSLYLWFYLCECKSNVFEQRWFCKSVEAIIVCYFQQQSASALSCKGRTGFTENMLLWNRFNCIYVTVLTDAGSICVWQKAHAAIVVNREEFMKQNVRDPCINLTQKVYNVCLCFKLTVSKCT